MKIIKGEKLELIAKLTGGVEIKANLNNWVLFIAPRNYSYYATLDPLFIDLLNYKIKQYAFNNKKKDIESLAEVIGKARKEIVGIMKLLTTINTS